MTSGYAAPVTTTDGYLDLAALVDDLAEEGIDLALREYTRDPVGKFATSGNRTQGAVVDRSGDGKRRPLATLADVRAVMRTWRSVPMGNRAATKARLLSRARALGAEPRLLALLSGLGDGDGTREAGEGSGAALRNGNARQWLRGQRGRAEGMALSTDEGDVVDLSDPDTVLALDMLDLAPGDYTPPYDWKHGFIPLTPAAVASKAGTGPNAGKGRASRPKGKKVPGKSSKSTTAKPKKVAGTTKPGPAERKAADDAARGRQVGEAPAPTEADRRQADALVGSMEGGDANAIARQIAQARADGKDTTQVDVQGIRRTVNTSPGGKAPQGGDTATPRKAPAPIQQPGKGLSPAEAFGKGGPRETPAKPTKAQADANALAKNMTDAQALTAAESSRTKPTIKRAAQAEVKARGLDTTPRDTPFARNDDGTKTAARDTLPGTTPAPAKPAKTLREQLGGSKPADRAAKPTQAELDAARRTLEKRYGSDPDMVTPAAVKALAQGLATRRAEGNDRGAAEAPSKPSGLEGRSAASMTPAEKVRAAETMHGTDSPQAKKARADASESRRNPGPRQLTAAEKRANAEKLDAGRRETAGMSLRELRDRQDKLADEGRVAVKVSDAELLEHQRAVRRDLGMEPLTPAKKAAPPRSAAPSTTPNPGGGSYPTKPDGSPDYAAMPSSQAAVIRARQRGLTAGASVNTDQGPGVVKGVTDRGVSVELDAVRPGREPDTINVAAGTPGYDRLEPINKPNRAKVDNAKAALQAAVDRKRAADATPGTPAAEPGTRSTNPDAPIRVSHGPDGTTVAGTERADAPELKAAGFKWSRNLNAWYLPRTWGQSTREQRVRRLEASLGDKVGVDRETGPRKSAAERDAETRERAASRAERMDSRAEKRDAEADRRLEASDLREEKSGIPFGQPILVGHHSERRHRNAIEKAHRNLGKGVEARAEADDARAAADRARRTAAGGESKVTTSNRIAKLEAERRDVERKLTGKSSQLRGPATGDYAQRLRDRAAELDDDLQFNRDKLEQAGGVPSKETVKPGDFVKVRGTWYPVKRSNAKTVSIPWWGNADRSDTTPWAEVTEHRKGSEVTRDEVAEMVGSARAFPPIQQALAKAAPDKDEDARRKAAKAAPAPREATDAEKAAALDASVKAARERREAAEEKGRAEQIKRDAERAERLAAPRKASPPAELTVRKLSGDRVLIGGDQFERVEGPGGTLTWRGPGNRDVTDENTLRKLNEAAPASGSPLRVIQRARPANQRGNEPPRQTPPADFQPSPVTRAIENGLQAEREGYTARDSDTARVSPETARRMSGAQLEQTLERLMEAGDFDSPAFKAVEAEQNRRDDAKAARRAEGNRPRR